MAKRGFQLLECLIVCLIIGLLSGIGGTWIQNLVDEYRLFQSARLLSNGLAQARAVSISHNLAVRVDVDKVKAQFGFATGSQRPNQWHQLPVGVRFLSEPRRPLTFYSRGSIVPSGTYRMTNRLGTVKVVVAASGRIRWEAIEP